jgi:hypothetical protein
LFVCFESESESKNSLFPLSREHEKFLYLAAVVGLTELINFMLPVLYHTDRVKAGL